jgi:carbon monoxide dehydrogenase subunit G
MIRCEASVEVDSPPDAAFAFLDNPANAPKWQGLCGALELTSRGAKRVGTPLRYTYRQGSHEGVMDGAITEYEPGKRLGMRFEDKMFGVDVSIRIAPSGKGSRIDQTVDITPRSFAAKLMAPLIRGAAKKQAEEDTAKLKRLLAD